MRFNTLQSTPIKGCPQKKLTAGMEELYCIKQLIAVLL